MYNSTFTQEQLDRRFNKVDFQNDINLKTPAYRQQVVQSAVALAKQGFGATNFVLSDLGGKVIYQIKDIASLLVLRKAALNLTKISKARQRNRLEVVKRLALLSQEGMPFTILKLDIKSFYESVDRTILRSMTVKRFSTAPSTRNVIDHFLALCDSQGVTGLPRGMAISAALSEFYLQDFDAEVVKIHKPFFYARYVDDIVLLMPSQTEFKVLRKSFCHLLRKIGLRLNNKKSKPIAIDGEKPKIAAIAGEFDYLGYKFQISKLIGDKPLATHRAVTLDLAPSKVKKRKTRITASFLRYLEDGNFDDLHDRLRILAFNYKYFDFKNGGMLLTGNYHVYRLIDYPSSALKELDHYLRGMLLDDKGPICARLRLSLSSALREQLLKISFDAGFRDKVHFNFDTDRLVHLVRCWKYV